MNIKAIHAQVKSAINTYGIDIVIKRDVYRNEVGVQTLVEKGKHIAFVKAIIDNSNKNDALKNYYKTHGVLKNSNTCTIYFTYDSTLKLQKGDYFILDGIRYTLGIPQDVLHYHLLIQVDCEVNEDVR